MNRILAEEKDTMRIQVSVYAAYAKVYVHMIPMIPKFSGGNNFSSERSPQLVPLFIFALLPLR